MINTGKLSTPADELPAVAEVKLVALDASARLTARKIGSENLAEDETVL